VTIYHKGLAEAFGITHAEMENMSVREMAERAFDLGGELKFAMGGAGPGLTLSASSVEVTVQEGS
jgi:hypothetical protein